MKPYKNFIIGNAVRVKGTVISYLSSNSKREVIKNSSAEFTAWYVGYTYLKEGRVIHSHGYSEDYDEGEIKVERTVLVARIREHSRGKEQFALFEDITKLENVNPDDIFDGNGMKTWKKHQSKESYEKYCKMLSDCAKDQNRDSKGKFTKGFHAPVPIQTALDTV